MKRKFTVEEREIQFFKYCFNLIEKEVQLDDEQEDKIGTIAFLLSLILDSALDSDIPSNKTQHTMGIFRWMSRLMKNNPGVPFDIILEAARSEQHTFEYLHIEKGFFCAIRPFHYKYDEIKKEWTKKLNI